MVSISLCMIVKDEEATIERCLNSVKDVVDEINIVDTGSTDRTKEIVSKYTERVYDFKWENHFAKARNFSFERATKEYILWLDADDVFLEEERRKLAELKENLDPSIDSVTMKYILGMDENGNITSVIRRNRLVKRSNGFKWHGMVHEYLEVGGNILNSDISLTHLSEKHDHDRNLLIYEQQLKEGNPLTIRDLFYYANELKDHQQYEKAIDYYEKFLSSGKGWVEDNIVACGRLADCYHHMGNHEKELDAVLHSFKYDIPRPEFCCRLGYHFLNKEEYHTAIHWYKQAIQCEVDDENWGFKSPSFNTWLPNLQLCVCYDRIGDYDMAYHHNEIASQYRPNDPSILHNKTYLESILFTSNVNAGSADGC
ncbi:glycosyltransferase [Pseudalkalibacillus sp. SCS-8]|uniref:tetratricopeptide repeat-containing glycosyltransferase family 2 protein n=1 Tax=Pseudalkalibacillus nanhaiensis TaxID=3115291 RepID=UPI0032DA1D84